MNATNEDFTCAILIDTSCISNYTPDISIQLKLSQGNNIYELIFLNYPINLPLILFKFFFCLSKNLFKILYFKSLLASIGLLIL